MASWGDVWNKAKQLIDDVVDDVLGIDDQPQGGSLTRTIEVDGRQVEVKLKRFPVTPVGGGGSSGEITQAGFGGASPWMLVLLLGAVFFMSR